MRSVLLLLGTAVLLGGGVAPYLLMQPGDVAKMSGDGAATTRHSALPIDPSESTYTVRGAKGAWLKRFDESRHQTSQFRGDDFVPQKDGSVRVKKPEAHFFLKNGQWIRVIGETGDEYFSNVEPGATDPFSGAGTSRATPSRGTLQIVRLQLFESLDAREPTLDMNMHNAAFDNETFRIFTEAYT